MLYHWFFLLGFFSSFPSFFLSLPLFPCPFLSLLFIGIWIAPVGPLLVGDRLPVGISEGLSVTVSH